MTLLSLVNDLKYIDRFGLDEDNILYTEKDAPFILAEDLEKIVERLEKEAEEISMLVDKLRTKVSTPSTTEPNVTIGCPLCGHLKCRKNCLK